MMPLKSKMTARSMPLAYSNLLSFQCDLR